MATITVYVWEQNADRRREVKVNEDCHVGEALQQLIPLLDLPETDESNLRMTYRLSRRETDQILNENQTLREAGVTDGSDLVLLPEPTAGIIK